jgi:hypothetical protein
MIWIIPLIATHIVVFGLGVWLGLSIASWPIKFGSDWDGR